MIRPSAAPRLHLVTPAAPTSPAPVAFAATMAAYLARAADDLFEPAP